MPLYSLIMLINGSSMFLHILTLIDMLGGFTRRKVSEEKQVCRSSHQGVETKDDVKPGVDLISNLPCSIIYFILGRLDLQDIVKMSILSRQWRQDCLTCPELVFDSRFNGMFQRCHKLKPLIHCILSQHQGPLLKFAVQLSDLKSCPEIDEWFHLLPGDTLQDLYLHISIGEKHKLTSHLYTFQNLINLRLSNCSFDPPPGFKGFSKLLNLDLQNVGIMPEKFGEFIHSCPVVENLRLIHCTKFDCLKITGPKLKFLEFSGVFITVYFRNCSVLSDVRLTFSSLDIKETTSFSFDLVKSLSSLPMLKELHLDAFALEGLVLYGAPNKLPMALKSLMTLHLTGMYFENPAEASSAICFIRSCPQLQKLNVQAFTSETVDMNSVAEFLQQQGTPPESLPCLKAVKMVGLCGIESEMQFVKFLLASTSSLKEMEIRPHASIVSDEGESIWIELIEYPRASPMAEIVTPATKGRNTSRTVA